MGKGSDRNHVSFWFWMFALFVMAIPCLGVIMIVVWAFVGENESRKNYFRALIAWFLIFVALWLAVLALGFGPEIQKQVQSWLRQWK